jgi:GT2 family glycosyltransferase
MRYPIEMRGTGTPRLVAGSHPRACGYDADIIVLTQDRLAETIEAVESAFRQQNVSFHVSVLDQGSPAAVRDGFALAFKDRGNFGYYVVDGNLGVAGGRNFLSGLGSGGAIVALDNDAVFADDLVVRKAVALFAESPGLGAIGFKILARDGVNLDAFSWGYPAGLKRFAHGNFASTTFVGAGHAIRRAAWIAAGGYDAELFFTWEEYDFSLRMIALRWTILYAGSLAVIHKVSPEARVGWQSERMKFFVRNRIIVARKWNLSWVELAPRIVGYLLKAARNRRLLPALSGLAQAVLADRWVLKRKLTAHMRVYLRENEIRFRDNLFGSFYRHVIFEMHADPK